MLLQVWQAEEPEEIELAEGTIEVGGSETDGLRIAGLPPALLRLRVEGRRLMVEPRETLEIDGIYSPPKVPRLVLPGQAVFLPGGVRLVQPPLPDQEAARSARGTAVVLKDLLGAKGDAPASRAASLLCLTGLDAGRRFPLAYTSTVVGRSQGADIRIRDQAVSRRHVRVRWTAEGYLAEDLGGPNGVYLNGGKLEGGRLLAGGDVLELGRSFLRFEGPESPPKPTVPDEAAAEREPERECAPPAKPRRRESRLEWLLILTGAALAVFGMMVSWALA